jgi:hypothetical protein
MKVEFFAEARLILIWGSNSIAEQPALLAPGPGGQAQWRAPGLHRPAAQRNGGEVPRARAAAARHRLRPWRSALMHELVVNDWLDHDYIERHTLGWAALRERALRWSPSAPRRSAACPRSRSGPGAGLRHHAACRHPPQLRHAAGARRRQRGPCRGLPARPDRRVAPSRGRHAAFQFRLLPVDRAYLQRPDLLGSRTPRTINMVTIGDDLLRPASPSFGPRDRSGRRLQQQPAGRSRRKSAKVVRGFAREDLFTVVLEQFQTDTADYADYVLPATTQLEHWDMHAPTATPTCC